MSSKLGRLLLVESRTREDKIKCSSGLGFPSRCHRQHTPIKITHQSHHQHHQRHSTQKILSQPSTSCSQHTQVMAVQPKHTQALPWVLGRGGFPAEGCVTSSNIVSQCPFNLYTCSRTSSISSVILSAPWLFLLHSLYHVTIWVESLSFIQNCGSYFSGL